VAQTCNPDYSGGRDQEDHGQGQPGPKIQWDALISTNKLDVVVYASHPSYTESVKRRVQVQTHLSINMRP
jgi:hypothetical protein